MNFEEIHPFKKRHEERNYLTCEFQEKHESGILFTEYEDEYPLVILDMLFCFTVITSLAIACYRGTWELMDLYHEYFPMWETFFLTIFAQLVFSFSQNFLHDVLIARIEKSVALKMLRFFLSNLYVLVFYVMGVAQLDSVWNILDCYSEQNETLIWLSVVSFFLLVLFRGVGNLSSVPACIEMDEEENIFRFNTRYFYKKGEKTSLYVLDCLFSVLIIGPLVVFVWRGVWLIIDLFLFPEDYVISSWASVVLGYICVIFAFLLQPAMRYLCERLSGLARLLVADFFILFALFGTVNVWRGIWNVLNLYFLPDDLELSCWITHWVCLIILVLCRCSNSLLVRGVYIDAEEPAGKCAVFPCYYLRVIFRRRKLKKMNCTSVTLDPIVGVKSRNEKIGDTNHIHDSIITNVMDENHTTDHS